MNYVLLTIGVLLACSMSYLAGVMITTPHAELRIAQDCAADGYFTVEQDGIRWWYKCGLPKLEEPE